MNKLVSVVVPVYNTEKYIEKCIQSILGQTYANLELILVHDGSKQNEEEIILKYGAKDSRVRLIKNNENLGLFRTRVRGIKEAKGEYIAIVDSDDYINRDFLRLLVEKAETDNADMVFATTVLNTPREKKAINIWQDVELRKLPLEGDNIKRAFFEQSGTAYVWHTIWNKLYSKSLWDKCLPYFEQLDKHVIMTEDIAFSSVLFYYAQKVSRVENSVYYYCQHEDASTSTKHISYDTYKKKVGDISTVFEFVENFYSDKEAWYKKQVNEFKKYYARVWNRGIINVESEYKADAKALIAEFCSDMGSQTTSDDGYFNLAQIPYHEGLDDIKERIWSSDVKYVSFDVFDTVITRPFYNPTDLFYLLDEVYEREMSTGVNFYAIRTEGERACREWKCPLESREDITLDDIYDYIENTYSIPHKLCQKLKDTECALEVQFSTNRQSVHEIYDIALLAGKRVVFISDMYLRRDTIEAILKKNGYEGYDSIFVSCEYSKLKTTGNLYKDVLKELGIEPCDVIHVGDNVRSDIERAREIGIDAIYVPKAMDVFEGKVEDIKTNRCATTGKEVFGDYAGAKSFEKLSGYGCMVAMIANHYFDNPFRAFHPMTDFNMDPYFMGYYALGMNLLAQIQWVKECKEQKNLGRVIFTARDGYMLKEAFRIFKKRTGDDTETDYMYVSRRAVLPAMLQGKTDFMNLPIVYQRYTPDMITQLLAFCSKSVDREQMTATYGVKWDRCFANIVEYHQFMKLYLEHIYSEEMHVTSIETLKTYWSAIEDNDYIYDMGYSGAIHNAIVKVSGKNATAMFMHTDKDKHNAMSRKGSFYIDCLMDTIPNISGLMREHFFSTLEGSCIGYKDINGVVEPIIEEEEKSYVDRVPLLTMQAAALKFVDDFYSRFHRYIPYLDIRADEVQMPFEGLLCKPSNMDTKIFMASYFEDKVYGAQAKLGVRSFWMQLLMAMPGCNGIDLVTNLDKLLEEKGKKYLAFFGTGRMCVDILEANPLPVKIFLDNNPDKDGTEWYGGKVYKPDNIENIKDLFIVIVCGMYMEIEEQLQDMGLNKFDDYVTFMEMF